EVVPGPWKRDLAAVDDVETERDPGPVVDREAPVRKGRTVGQVRCDPRLALVEEAPARIRHRLDEGTVTGARGDARDEAGGEAARRVHDIDDLTSELVGNGGVERRRQVGPLDPWRHGSRVDVNGYAVRMESERTPRT